MPYTPKELNGVVLKFDARSTEEWVNSTKAIIKGALCFEELIDGKFKIKIGDGLHMFSELPYVDSDAVTETQLNNALQSYVTKASIDAKLEGYATLESVSYDLSGKVDSVEGMGLSSNDFTDQEKVKLDSLVNYDDTEIKTDIEQIDRKNTEQDETIANLQTAVSGNTSALNVLNGTGPGSVKKQVSDCIAEVVAGAPEDFDTLKEMSDWITEHSDSAAAMNSQIQENVANIANIEENKADRSEIPTSLPADGGNADTVGGKSAEELIQSNPNLLLNPDFKVNQRGETIFNGSTNSNAMDRWQIPSDTLAAYTENGIKITNNRSEGQRTWFYQDIGTNLTGRELTVSVCAKGTGKISIGYINGPNDQFDLTNEYHIYSYSFIPQQLLEGWEHIFGMYLYGSETYVKWIKLEFGGVATPFVPPNPLKEALKCGPLKNAEQQIFYDDGRWANAPSNPNLLDNPDFKINQRGQSEYTGITYTVDRWRMFDSSSRIEVVNSGIKITTLTAAGTNSNTNALFQLLNHPVDTYSGKQLTLSLKATDTTGPWAICIRFGKAFPSGDYITAIYQQIFSGVNRWTFTVPDQAISMRIGIIQHGPYGSTVGDTITVEWTKLELGSVATPFIPPNPATELLKCMRYCVAITGGVIREYTMSPNVMLFFVPLPTNMRVTPSFESGKEGLNVRLYGTSTEYSDWAWTVVARMTTPYGLVFQANKTNHGIPVGTGGFLRVVDGERLILSADL